MSFTAGVATDLIPVQQNHTHATLLVPPGAGREPGWQLAVIVAGQNDTSTFAYEPPVIHRLRYSHRDTSVVDSMTFGYVYNITGKNFGSTPDSVSMSNSTCSFQLADKSPLPYSHEAAIIGCDAPITPGANVVLQVAGQIGSINSPVVMAVSVYDGTADE
jgi:hypothetical protein